MVSTPDYEQSGVLHMSLESKTDTLPTGPESVAQHSSNWPGVEQAPPTGRQYWPWSGLPIGLHAVFPSSRQRCLASVQFASRPRQQVPRFQVPPLTPSQAFPFWVASGLPRLLAAPLAVGAALPSGAAARGGLRHGKTQQPGRGQTDGHAPGGARSDEAQKGIEAFRLHAWHPFPTDRGLHLNVISAMSRSRQVSFYRRS
jgi:hypothetical protein